MAVTLLANVVLAATALAPPVLTTAREVRSLPARDVPTARPVRLTGVVTFTAPPHTTFQIQDATGGVCVHWKDADVPLRRGDRVEVDGVPVPGAFLPEVRAVRVTVIQAGVRAVHYDLFQPGALWAARDGLFRPSLLPEPVPFNLTIPESGYLDGQWVVVEGVLQRAWGHEGWLKLDLSRGGADAVVVLPMGLGADLREAQKLSGSVVRVRGVCRAQAHPQQRPSGNPRLFVTSLRDFEVLVCPPADPFNRQQVTAADLGLYRPDPVKARLPVRMTGVITLNQSGRQAYIQDDLGGVVYVTWVNPEMNVRPGQRVEVVGFPRLYTDPTARLDNARVREPKGGPRAGDRLPDPVPGTAADALAGRLEGRVARFTGVVTEAGRQGIWPTLTVVADGVTFTTVLLDEGATAEPGSRVEVVGVVTKQPLDKFRAHTFAVVVHTGGLKVLAPPPRAPEAPPADWWTPTRVGVLSAGFLGLLAVSGTGLAVLRTRVRRAIAQKEKLETRLKAAGKLEALGRLAGGVAHDFNNLLTVINGSAQLLAEDGEDPARAAELIDRIRRAGTQAAALTGRLLTFGRARGVKPQPLDLNAAVTESAPLLLSLLGERVRLRVVTPPGVPPVLADPGLVTQILLNLAVNARDAMPEGGTLTLATAAGPNRVRLSVSDTGCGIPEELRPHIFELFFTTKEAGKGTGLGLPTVHDIVQSLGGEIGFDSTPGQGTTFHVDLPTAPDPPAGGAPVPVPPKSVPALAPGAPARAGVVLLVEDDEAVRALARLVLEGAGLKVRAVAGPDEALQFLDPGADPIDLLVTDVVMPGISGQQLAARARTLRPDLPVLFLSGYTAEEVQLQDVPEAGTDFLHKPFLPRDLTACVRRMLGHSTH